MNPFYLPPNLETHLEKMFDYTPCTFSEQSSAIADNELLDVFENKTPVPFESKTPTSFIHPKIVNNYQNQTQISAGINDVFENNTPTLNEANTPIILQNPFS